MGRSARSSTSQRSAGCSPHPLVLSSSTSYLYQFGNVSFVFAHVCGSAGVGQHIACAHNPTGLMLGHS
eukprot:3857770-Prymnesium_polylepis.1